MSSQQLKVTPQEIVLKAFKDSSDHIGQQPYCTEENWTSVSPSKLCPSMQVGEGLFTNVYRTEFRGSPVAVKKFKCAVEVWDVETAEKVTDWCQLSSEARSLRSELLVRCWGFAHTPDNMPCIIEELMDMTLLDRFCSDDTERDFFGYLETVVDGLMFLHTDVKVVHGDLTPLNVLWKDGRVKIANAGVPQWTTGPDLEHPVTRLLDTAVYRPPEALLDAHPQFSKEWDVFSLAVMAIALLTRLLPCTRARQTRVQLFCRAAVPETIRRNGDLARLEDHPLRPIIEQCLHLEPGQRPCVSRFQEAVQNQRKMHA